MTIEKDNFVFKMVFPLSLVTYPTLIMIFFIPTKAISRHTHTTQSLSLSHMVSY